MGKNIFLILIVFLICSSCTKIVQEEFPDFAEKPVVNSLFIDGVPIQVYVSLTKKLDKTPLEGFDNAIIKLFEEERFIEVIPSVGKGMYKSSMLAKQGKQYILEIEIKDFDKKILKASPPPQEKIVNIIHINEAGVNNDGYTCPAFKITFTTDPTKKEYFQIRADSWNSYYDYSEYSENSEIPPPRPLKKSPVQIINISDPILLNESLPILVFSNEKIKESVYTMYIEYDGNRGLKRINGVFKNVLCPLSIELQSIDSAYYHYLKSAYLYERGRTESSIGEVYSNYQLFSNIPGGYGLVGAYSVDKYDTIFPEGK
ncbi:MAG: DUF4249 family protein [Bacteroidales bacterium]